MDAEPGWVHNEQGDRSASIVNIDNGKTVAAVAVCAAVCGLSMGIALWAAWTSDKTTIEYRVMLNHQMQLENDLKTLQEKYDALR